MKRPTTTYNKQETAWNDPQRVRHNLQWPEKTYNEQRKYAKRPTTSIFPDYFTIWGNRFSSLTRFLLNIWLQSFEHYFTENHGENRAPSIYYHASSLNYHLYFLRDIRFISLCLGFASVGKGKRYFFLLHSTTSTHFENRLVFSVCIYREGLMMNEDFQSGSRNRTTFFYQFVIFKPLSYCFEETIGFGIKASFASRSVSRIIRWYKKPGDIKKEFGDFTVPRDFSWIENYKLLLSKPL